MLQLCEQVNGSQGVASGVTASGGDVGGAGEAVSADCEVAQYGHHGGAVSGADLGEVLGEDDIAHLLQGCGPVAKADFPRLRSSEAGEGTLAITTGVAQVGSRGFTWWGGER
jgi:hypothetical protein